MKYTFPKNSRLPMINKNNSNGIKNVRVSEETLKALYGLHFVSVRINEITDCCLVLM